ncbi:MAG: hypothetical protein PHW00_04295 [Clostridia bacterium]|nr:hypothetical protein [Clostridia bacterium]
MKMNCVKCLAIGMLVGVMAGSVLVQTCPPFKQAVQKGKDKVKQMIDKVKCNQDSQGNQTNQANQQNG